MANTEKMDISKAIVEETKKSPIKKKKKSKKKRSKRCFQCNKKVGMFGFTCKCGKLFCSVHRYASEHGCTYDYRKEHQEKIKLNNPDANFNKVNEI